MRRRRELFRLACKRALIAVAIGAPLAGFALYGCNSSTEPPLEDYCGWLADEQNCFRKFGEDVLGHPGAAKDSVPRCTNLGLNPTPTAGAQLGTFQSRKELEKCFILGGGIIAFDPPIALDKLPIAEPVGFKMINTDESQCAEVSWADVDRFTITFAGDTVADGGTLTDEQVVGGTFLFQRKVGRKTVSTGCPGGESHYFDLLQVDKCTEYANVQPRAELNVITGGLDETGQPKSGSKYGAISFSVFYQPTTGDQANAVSSKVDYFTCVIPPPPERCVDGVQNGEETDVDCGGTPVNTMFPTCDRCDDGAKCIVNGDCKSGSCSEKMGIKKCDPTPDPATTAASSSSSTGGGTGGAGGAMSSSSSTGP